MNKLSLLLLLLILMGVEKVTNAAPEKPKVTGQSLANEFWEVVDQAVPPSLYEKDPVGYAEKLSNYTFELFSENGILRKIYADQLNENPELEDEFGACVTAVFGRKSSQMDFKWFFVLEQYATPWYGHVREWKDDSYGSKKFILLLAKHLSLAFAEDHQLLVRYQYALAWRGIYVRGGDIAPNDERYPFARFTWSIKEFVKSLLAKNDSYWLYVRNYLVIAYSTTGELHLPKGKEELTKIPELSKAWALCFGERGPFLRPSPFQPYWRIDTDLEKTGYGYVIFSKHNGHKLPDLIFVPSRPFPDGPDMAIPRDIGFCAPE